MLKWNTIINTAPKYCSWEITNQDNKEKQSKLLIFQRQSRSGEQVRIKNGMTSKLISDNYRSRWWEQNRVSVAEKSQKLIIIVFYLVWCLYLCGHICTTTYFPKIIDIIFILICIKIWGWSRSIMCMMMMMWDSFGIKSLTDAGNTNEYERVWKLASRKENMWKFPYMVQSVRQASSVINHYLLLSRHMSLFSYFPHLSSYL